MKEFKSGRSECYNLVGAYQGIVCSVWIFRKHWPTYSALEATILVGSLQFKNAAGAGVRVFDTCTDTTYFTKNYLKIIPNLTEKSRGPLIQILDPPMH